MRGVQEVGEEEPDELEGDGDKHVPEEGEERSRGEMVDDHVTWSVGRRGGMDGCFPVGWNGICLSHCV